ncbi:MAG: NapC/NirT family cytochrome c [Burkholderiales bacterium]|nr:NapC/NirT family cytochrome c [Burkholderiales bacterium]
MQRDKRGIFSRLWTRLTSPSARWSVLSLVVIGVVAGAGAVIATEVVVAKTGTNAFCGTACHSMQWVYAETRQSVHYANPSGVQAQCGDCHIPHGYPEKLWYKAKAGVRDAIGEMRGVISTEEKFKQARLAMAERVWAEFKANDSANCRACHDFTPAALATQSEKAQARHKGRTKTCIECHSGVAHVEPE